MARTNLTLKGYQKPVSKRKFSHKRSLGVVASVFPPFKRTRNKYYGQVVVSEDSSDEIIKDNTNPSATEIESIIEVTETFSDEAEEDFVSVGSSSSSSSSPVAIDTKVDFHGFQVLATHASYLERLYAKDKDFWSTCVFKATTIITQFLDSLGEALAIIDETPCSDLPTEKLQLMLRVFVDVLTAGFRLDLLKEHKNTIEDLVTSLDHKQKTEAELVNIDEEMEKLDNQEKDLRRSLEDVVRQKAMLQERQRELKGQLDELVPLTNTNDLLLNALITWLDFRV